MLHSYFYTLATGNVDQNSGEHKQVSNFMHMYDKDHSTITGKPYLADDQRDETENSETDFISFYDIFGAVNY